MNNQELKNFRKDFHDNLELGFLEKHKLSFKDYEKILKKTIKNTRICEESSKEIYIYIGSYTMRNGELSLTYMDDNSALFRKYKDIESEKIVQINKYDTKTFESMNYVIYGVADELTEECYEDVYEVFRYAYFKELLNSSEIDAYKLIKRLTPLK